MIHFLNLRLHAFSSINSILFFPRILGRLAGNLQLLFQRVLETHTQIYSQNVQQSLEVLDLSISPLRNKNKSLSPPCPFNKTQAKDNLYTALCTEGGSNLHLEQTRIISFIWKPPERPKISSLILNTNQHDIPPLSRKMQWKHQRITNRVIKKPVKQNLQKYIAYHKIMLKG